MGFDIEGAKKAGYSEAEILSHLATSKNAWRQVEAAWASGKKDADIISELSADKGSEPSGPSIPGRMWTGLKSDLWGLARLVGKSPEVAQELAAALARPEGRAEIIRPIKESIENPAGIPGRIGAYAIDHPLNTLLNALPAAGIASRAGGVANLMRRLKGGAVVPELPPIRNPIMGGLPAMSRMESGLLPGEVSRVIPGTPMPSPQFRGTGADLIKSLESQPTPEAMLRQKLMEMEARKLSPPAEVSPPKGGLPPPRATPPPEPLPVEPKSDIILPMTRKPGAGEIPTGKAPEPVGGIKEPWQMTREEFREAKEVYKKPYSEFVEAKKVLPPHEVRNQENLRKITEDMDTWGYTDRPILVAEGPNGLQALTGSHRIPAAQKLGIEIPIERVDQVKLEKYLAKNDLTLDEFTYLDPDTISKAFKSIGDKRAARLFEKEIEIEGAKYEHKGFVRRALAEGKYVPDAVLKDYPDLLPSPSPPPGGGGGVSASPKNPALTPPKKGGR